MGYFDDIDSRNDNDDVSSVDYNSQFQEMLNNPNNHPNDPQLYREYIENTDDNHDQVFSRHSTPPLRQLHEDSEEKGLAAQEAEAQTEHTHMHTRAQGRPEGLDQPEEAHGHETEQAEEELGLGIRRVYIAQAPVNPHNPNHMSLNPSSVPLPTETILDSNKLGHFPSEIIVMKNNQNNQNHFHNYPTSNPNQVSVNQRVRTHDHYVTKKVPIPHSFAIPPDHADEREGNDDDYNHEKEEVDVLSSSLTLLADNPNNPANPEVSSEAEAHVPVALSTAGIRGVDPGNSRRDVSDLDNAIAQRQAEIESVPMLKNIEIEHVSHVSRDQVTNDHQQQSQTPTSPIPHPLLTSMSIHVRSGDQLFQADSSNPQNHPNHPMVKQQAYKSSTSSLNSNFSTSNNFFPPYDSANLGGRPDLKHVLSSSQLSGEEFFTQYSTENHHEDEMRFFPPTEGAGDSLSPRAVAKDTGGPLSTPSSLRGGDQAEIGTKHISREQSAQEEEYGDRELSIDEKGGEGSDFEESEGSELSQGSISGVTGASDLGLFPTLSLSLYIYD